MKPSDRELYEFVHSLDGNLITNTFTELIGMVSAAQLGLGFSKVDNRYCLISHFFDWMAPLKYEKGWQEREAAVRQLVRDVFPESDGNELAFMTIENSDRLIDNFYDRFNACCDSLVNES